jgi:L-lactate dehydrogenase (cytochrome)
MPGRQSSTDRALASPYVVNIRDLQRLARRRLPRAVFDYIDGGADDEVTLRENCRAFEAVTLRPRQAVAVREVDLHTSVLGTVVNLPVLLAPVGSCRLFYPQGDVHAARAAHAAGTAHVLSTFSGSTLEEVREASAGPMWYQLYIPGGREVATATIGRARAAGYSALVVTIDTPVAGMRERDVRNGVPVLLRGNVWSRVPYIWQFLSRPRWLTAFLRDGGLMKFPNVVLPGIGPMPYSDVGVLLERTAVTWRDLAWIRDAWGGPLVIKGVLTGDDARRALDEGADAIVVSNHGGRQLDGAAASVRVLPDVVSAVAGRCEVLMDGGIRRGSDVIKALCLGARAVLVGRAYAWGLGAAGEAGVARAIEILRTEMTRTLRLIGCESVSALDGTYIERPAEWTVAPHEREARART